MLIHIAYINNTKFVKDGKYFLNQLFFIYLNSGIDGGLGWLFKTVRIPVIKKTKRTFNEPNKWGIAKKLV